MIELQDVEKYFLGNAKSVFSVYYNFDMKCIIMK